MCINKIQFNSILLIVIKAQFFITCALGYSSYENFIAQDILKNVSQYAIDNGYDNFQDDFESFKNKYNKSYDITEEVRRKYNFLNNFMFIERHHQMFINGNATYDVGINSFSDMDYQDYKNMFHIKLPIIKNKAHSYYKSEPKYATKLPDSFDWRSLGKVSPVKTQHGCGSCWAFSTLAAIESAFLIEKNMSLILSEQQLVDCMDSHCRGRTIQSAYKFIIKNGVTTDQSYPYLAKFGNCKFKNGHIKIKDYHRLGRPNSGRPASDEGIKNLIMNQGPLTVMISSAGNDFAFYRGGILSTGKNEWENVHAVALIGWGPDYWIIKNSWGTEWGDNGFGLMKIGANFRGINEFIYWPVL